MNYLDVDELKTDGELRRRVGISILVAINVIKSEGTGVTGHDKRVLWASTAYQNIERIAGDLLGLLLVDNLGLTKQEVQEATDSEIQAKVNPYIDILAGNVV